MAKTLYKYEASSNKFVWFTTWDRALKNYYSEDYNYVPRPIIGNEYNTNVEFRSRKPGMANVDWGDGVKEQYPMIKVQGQNDYRIIFRSLAVQYRKNPDTTWWFRREDGSQYVPVDNHAYADGRKDVQRVVSIDFTCDIYYARISDCRMTSFPIVDIPDLETLIVSHTMHVNDGIPVDKLSRSKKLTYIELQNVGQRMTEMPEAITNKTEVYYLNLFNMLDLRDIEASGIRNIKNMKKIENLNLSSCYLDRYIKEFNDLPKLNTLNMTPAPSGMWNYLDLNTIPSFEVDKINPMITTFDFLQDWMASERRTGWNDDNMSGRGLEYITGFSTSHCNSLRMDKLPDYIYEMRAITWFSVSCSTHSQQRSDDFVNSFYKLVTEWDQITMTSVANDGKRNQFYGLSVSMYSATFPTENQRPSGTEQAPEGFVKGQSNGSPATPMEKIYVLKNNYAQKWTIKPA